jgi:hypothetical protein
LDYASTFVAVSLPSHFHIGEVARSMYTVDPSKACGFLPAFINLSPSAAFELADALLLPRLIPLGIYNLTTRFLYEFTKFQLRETGDGQNLTFIVSRALSAPSVAFLTEALKASDFQFQLIDDCNAFSSYYLNASVDVWKHAFTKVLVVDVGATSTKAYLLEFQMANAPPTVRHISYHHNDTIGGAFMTARLVKYILLAFELAEQIKINLSYEEEVRTVYRCPSGGKIDVTVNRGEFEYMILDFIGGIEALMVRAMARHKPDQVVLIGGSSKVPRVQTEVFRVTGCNRFHISQDVDEVLLLGALEDGRWHKPGTEFSSFPFHNVSVTVDGEVKQIASGMEVWNDLRWETTQRPLSDAILRIYRGSTQPAAPFCAVSRAFLAAAY